MKVRSQIAVMTLALFAAMAGVIPAAAQDQLMRSLTVQPGDEVEVKVVGYPDLSDTYHVDSDGMVELMLVGRIEVGGLDPVALRRQISDHYGKHLASHPQIIVQQRYRVGVVGQVGKPGLYHVDGTETVTQLLALAGGPGREARLSKATLSRLGKSETRNLERSLTTGETVYEMGIQSGDILYIPERPWYTDWRNWSTIVSSALLAFNVWDRTR